MKIGRRESKRTKNEIKRGEVNKGLMTPRDDEKVPGCFVMNSGIISYPKIVVRG